MFETTKCAQHYTSHMAALCDYMTACLSTVNTGVLGLHRSARLKEDQWQTASEEKCSRPWWPWTTLNGNNGNLGAIKPKELPVVSDKNNKRKKRNKILLLLLRESTCSPHLQGWRSRGRWGPAAAGRGCWTTGCRGWAWWPRCGDTAWCPQCCHLGSDPCRHHWRRWRTRRRRLESGKKG